MQHYFTYFSCVAFCAVFSIQFEEGKNKNILILTDMQGPGYCTEAYLPELLEECEYNVSTLIVRFSRV
jgi:hypothetical protein